MTGASRSPDSPRHLVLAVMAVVVVIALGALGYIVIEGWPAFDVFYPTVMTVATIGYQELHPCRRLAGLWTDERASLGRGTCYLRQIYMDAVVSYFEEKE